MNLGVLERKHIITFWRLTLLMVLLEILLQIYPYFHFYSKSEYTLGEYTLSSFYNETQVRSTKKYSIFVDENGNTVKIEKALKDYIGRRTKLYVKDKDHAFRVRFELKYINICDIIVIFWIISISVITVLWLRSINNKEFIL